jgi:hypothetical protein
VFGEQVRACSVGGLFRFRHFGECALIYMLIVILVLVAAAASAIVVIATWTRARRLGADGDSNNGQVMAVSVGGLFHIGPSLRCRPF